MHTAWTSSGFVYRRSDLTLNMFSGSITVVRGFGTRLVPKPLLPFDFIEIKNHPMPENRIGRSAYGVNELWVCVSAIGFDTEYVLWFHNRGQRFWDKTCPKTSPPIDFIEIKNRPMPENRIGTYAYGVNELWVCVSVIGLDTGWVLWFITVLRGFGTNLSQNLFFQTFRDFFRTSKKSSQLGGIFFLTLYTHPDGDFKS